MGTCVGIRKAARVISLLSVSGIVIGRSVPSFVGPGMTTSGTVRWYTLLKSAAGELFHHSTPEVPIIVTKRANLANDEAQHVIGTKYSLCAVTTAQDVHLRCCHSVAAVFCSSYSRAV